MATETTNLTAVDDPESVDDKKVEKTPPKKSVLEDLKSAKQQSSNSIQFARTFCGVIFGSVLWTVLVGIFNIIPITMIVIGSVYLNDCKIERMIPVYLVVYGALLLFRYLWTSCLRCSAKNDSDDIREKDVDTFQFCTVLVVLLDFFLIIWFIIGNVWIYGNFPDVQYHNKGSSSYCHGVLYLFAFWHTTLHYIILGLLMLCCPCIICYYYVNVQP